MFKVFWLEFISLVRSWTLPLLVAASVGWTLLAPHFVRGDGTEAGDRTIVLGYALFGVLALVFIALAASAAGSLSCERAAKRLQLTLLRPVSFFAVAFGRVLALTAAGSLIFALSLAVLLVRSDGELCRHVLHPVMETPREEAEKMYEVYMKDSETPDEVKRARRESVIAILTQKALDHYLPVPTNAVTSWEFQLPEIPAATPIWARIRFSDTFSRRQDVRGVFNLGCHSSAVVSNISQSVNLYPLVHSAAIPAALTTLHFENRGTSSLMLRPRRDVELLIAADSRFANYCRGWLELTALLMTVVALGVFLGAALSRPVAVWTVLVVLVLSIASPAVVEQYPMELEIPRDDAIALVLSRTTDTLTRPLNSFSPVARLSENECLEWSEVVTALALDALLLPFVLTMLSAWALRRKR